MFFHRSVILGVIGDAMCRFITVVVVLKRVRSSSSSLVLVWVCSIKCGANCTKITLGRVQRTGWVYGVVGEGRKGLWRDTVAEGKLPRLLGVGRVALVFGALQFVRCSKAYNLSNKFPWNTSDLVSNDQWKMANKNSTSKPARSG